jgi:hypothetical protein
VAHTTQPKGSATTVKSATDSVQITPENLNPTTRVRQIKSEFLERMFSTDEN